MRNSLSVRRLLGFILLVAFVALSAVVINYFINSSSQVGKPALRPVDADVALKSIHFTESDATAKKWELFAESGAYNKPTDTSSLTIIRFIIERNGTGGPVTVTARRGEYAHASKNVRLEGDVQSRTKEGTTFSTASLVYYAARRVIHGTERVILADNALKVEGTGFELNLDSQETRIYRDITATINPGKKRQ
jgi:LPS export ABC transporter protein LptC